MADIIQLSPEILEAKAREIRNLNEQQKQVIQKLTNLVNGLNEMWKGDAQVAFDARFRELSPTFKNLDETLITHANDMEAFARRMRENDRI